MISPQDSSKTKALKERMAVPMIKALFYQVADPEKLVKLDLVEVLDWTARTFSTN
jgi:hypothetical protein